MENKKAAITLFLLAILARLLMLGLISAYGTDVDSVINTKLNPRGTDGEYIQLALNVISYKTLSISPESPPKPNSARTPLYSFFLLPFIYYGAPYWIVALVLDFIASSFLVIFYLAAKKIFNPKIIFGTAVFFALEPASVLYSNSATVTENLLMPFFIGAFLLFARFIINPQPRYFYIASLLLALSALIRPSSLYFFLFFPVIGYLSGIPLKKNAVQTLTAVIIFFLILSPLMFRNKIVLDSWQVSSIQDYNTYTRLASSFCLYLQEKCERDFASSIERLTKEHDYDIYNGHNPAKYRKPGLDLIKSRPIDFAGFFISRIPNFFLKNNYVDILQIFTERNLYENGGRKIDLVFLFRIFGKMLAILLFLLFLGSFLLLLTGRTDKRLLMLSMLFVIYTAVISTPTDFVRYRIPIILPMTILALETLKFFFTALRHSEPFDRH